MPVKFPRQGEDEGCCYCYNWKQLEDQSAKIGTCMHRYSAEVVPNEEGSQRLFISQIDGGSHYDGCPGGMYGQERRSQHTQPE